MDPLLYVSSSLFILGAGMLFIRCCRAGAGHLPDWEEMVEAGGICSVP